MKAIILLTIYILSVTFVIGQNSNPNYNEALAKELGADDCEMKSYTLIN